MAKKKDTQLKSEDTPVVPPVPAPSATASAPGPGPAGAAPEGGSLLRSAGIVGFMTILSRILGLWRFRLMASIFGATGVADAFNFAFIFPNLTRRLFGEGALTSAFVPVFSRQLAKGEREAANRTASVLLCRLTYWLSTGCIALICLSALSRYLLPRFMEIEPYYILELKLFEAMLPYCVLINVAAVLMGILNSLGHFTMPAFAPVLLNVLMILACKYALPYFGETAYAQIWALAAAVLLGGISQVLIQVPPALAKKFRFAPAMSTTDPGYQEVMASFKPVILLVAVFQANVMVDNIIAQLLIPGTGPVTYLNMGTSVYQMPWSVFSLALGTAALPALSQLWALEKYDGFRKTMFSALRMTIYLAVPCTVGIVLLSEDIVRLLYGTGKFLENDAEPVRRTAGVVLCSTLGLVFFSVNAILARALYAMKDMKTPTTTSFKSVFLNLILNLALVFPLRESGIALASAISAAWQTVMLARAIAQKQAAVAKPAAPALSAGFMVWIGGTACVSVLAGYLGCQHFSRLPEWEGFWGFLAAAVFSLIPFWGMGRQYFLKKLEHAKRQNNPALRLGVEESQWPEELKFEFSLYTTVLASAIMGLLVWAVRDSVPPEGHTPGLMAQRALAPVAAGMLVYASASSGLLAREYDELRSAFTLRFKRRAG